MGFLESFGFHPMMEMAMQCSMFAFFGSFLCQLLFAPKGKSWDVLNMITLMSYNALCFAPTAYYWYPFIETMLPAPVSVAMDMTLFTNVALKVLMDQFVYSPLLLSWFWFHSTFLATRDINASVAAIPANVVGSLVSSLCYWPFVLFINIGLVPKAYNVLVINIASVPWNMYVSYSVSQSKAEAAAGGAKGGATKETPGKRGKKRKRPRKDM